MNAHEMTTSIRTSLGKGGARKIRAKGQIPAVVYGKGFDSLSITCLPSELKGIFKTRYGRNSVLRLKQDDGNVILAMLKDVQLHPVSREPEHVDFLRITEDKPVMVNVPLHLDGRAAGVVEGGTLKQLHRDLPLKCLPKDIPVEVRVDVTALKMGEHLHVHSLALPSGTTLATSEDFAVASVIH